jgi:hypothetical protein
MSRVYKLYNKLSKSTTSLSSVIVYVMLVRKRVIIHVITIIK